MAAPHTHLLRSWILASLFLLGATLAPSEAMAACGGTNQRPCNVWERVPSCNAWLEERVESCGLFCVRTICRDNGCGGDGESACVPFVDHGYANVCQNNLGNIVGTCRPVDLHGFPAGCGHDGQSACNAAIQASAGISSCVPGAWEDGFPFGTCRDLGNDGFPTSCGHDGQNACDAGIQVQLGISSCVPDTFERGFPLGVCEALDPEGYPLDCGGALELACDITLQVQLGITPCKAGLTDYNICMDPIDLGASPEAWASEEHVPSDFVDGQRHVFVLHGMISSRFGKNHAVVRTLLDAGHRVYTVDYAANRALLDPAPITIEEVHWKASAATDPVWPLAGTTPNEYTGLTIGLQDVADELATAIEALIPPGEHVSLVSHSMGGLISRLLVARHYDHLRNQGVRITEVATMGTPHDGSSRDLGAWVNTILPDGGLNFAIDTLSNLGMRTFSCEAVPIMFGISNVDHLLGLDDVSIWPRALFQNCQMEAFHNEIDQSSRSIDDSDYPQIRWGLVAGRIDANTDEDGAVPVVSALSIASDESVTVTADHSGLLDERDTQTLLQTTLGIAADLAAPECENGVDDDADGIEDAVDPQCVSGRESRPVAMCGVGPELVLVMPVLMALNRRRRAVR